MEIEYPDLFIEHVLYHHLLTEMRIFVNNAHSWVTSLHISLGMIESALPEQQLKAIKKSQETVLWVQNNLALFAPLLSTKANKQSEMINLDDFFKKHQLFFAYLANNRQLIRPSAPSDTISLTIQTGHFTSVICANESKLILVFATLLQLLYGTAQGVSNIFINTLHLSHSVLQKHTNYLATTLPAGNYTKIQLTGSDINLNKIVSRWQQLCANPQESDYLYETAIATKLILQEMSAGLWLTQLPTGRTATTILLPTTNNMM